MKTTFDIQELETIARKYEASMETVRAQAEAQAKEIVAHAEKLAAEYQRMADAHRLVIQNLLGAAGVASTVSSQLADSAKALGEQVDALNRAALDSGVAVNANADLLAAQVRNLMDAGRWLIGANAIPNEFDVGRFRDGIESRFREIAEAVSDRNAYSKVLLKLAEEGDITIKERGRGRRPSIYEIAAADGRDAM
jgi:ABC-type transporter Mla subunit MlaD